LIFSSGVSYAQSAKEQISYEINQAEKILSSANSIVESRKEHAETGADESENSPTDEKFDETGTETAEENTSEDEAVVEENEENASEDSVAGETKENSAEDLTEEE